MAGRRVSEPARQVAEEARQREWREPSFGRELFLGRLRLDLIHPHPRTSEQERRKGEPFLEQLESFLREEVDPAQIERDAKIPERVVQRLKDLGAFGMKIDEEYGGLGLSQVYYCRALMIAGSWHASLSTLLSAHQSIGVPQPLNLFGTEEQKRRYLPLVAKEEISAFLLSEPHVGSDPARTTATATPADEDRSYLLNGEKLWTTNGVIADRLMVVARVPRSDGHRGGISAFIVDAHAPGVTVKHRNEFMGLRGIENGVTRFEDVRIPVEDRIGEEGQGLRIALTTLNAGRLSLPAICAAATKWALKIAREWCGERVQWGRRIGEHDAVAQKVAFIAGMAFALEALAQLSSAMADKGNRDIRIEAALSKLYSSEMAWLALDELVQIRGGRGFETAASLKARGEKPVPAEQVLRDMRINRIFEGSTEIMHLLIAREAVDQHLRVAGGLVEADVKLSEKAKIALEAGAFYARWLPRLTLGRGQLPATYQEFGEHASHVRFIERSARRLARSTFYGISRWGAKLEPRQTFLGRTVDIGAELYAMSAACVRARMLLEDAPSAEGRGAVELADVFCRGAQQRVERLFHDLWHNDDDVNYAAAQRVLAGRYRFAERGVLDPSGEGPMLGDPEGRGEGSSG
ncbi:MAG: acyl-CoA dehydrogenase family protein [Actinomycetota bacterium]|nr:acyl-CoA dehydrogenase family protein [Actinomycetota bacterium]